MGLFLATGSEGRLSLLDTGKQFPARGGLMADLCWGSGVSTGVGSSLGERRLLLLSGVVLSLGVQVLLSLAGEDCSLLDSPPMLNFLTTLFTSEIFGSVVVLDLRTGLLTMGTMVSGILK